LPIDAPAVSANAAPLALPPADFVPEPLRSAGSAQLPPEHTNLQVTTSGERLLSFGKKAPASSSDPLLPPRFATDGRLNTAWRAGQPDINQWLQVGFSRPITLTKIIIDWDAELLFPFTYKIDASVNGQSFTTVATRADNSDPQTTDTFNTYARYLRVTITDSLGSGREFHYMGVFEAQVYGIATLLADQNNPPLPCPCAAAAGPHQGGPFNPRTGYLWTSTTDLALPSPGPDIRWTRTYVSRSTDVITGPLGAGWQHPYNARLIAPGMSGVTGIEAGTIVIVLPDGNKARFRDLGGGVYEALPGVFSELTRAGNEYTHTGRDQTTYRFDATNGRLTAIRDPQGRVLNLIYTGTPAKLTTIRDAIAATRALTMTYTAEQRIESVTDGTRVVRYTYLNGDLRTVTDVMGRVTTYTYQNHLLTRIDNALGQAIEQTTYDQYTPVGRVIDQTLQDGRRFQVVYQSDKSIVTTTGPDGRTQTQEFGYSPGNTMTTAVMKSGTASLPLTTVSADENFAPGSAKDGRGNITLTSYNRMGQPEQIVDALDQVTTLDYDTRSRPMTVTDTLNRKSVFVYDTNNNLVRATTGITTAFPLGFTTVYTYNVRYPGKQWLEDQRTPDNIATRYEYDALGQMTTMVVGFGTAQAQTTSYTYDQLGRRITTTVGVGTPLARTDRIVYNNDNTIKQTIQNYKAPGVYTPSRPDENITTTYSYDKLGRTVAVTDTLGFVAATHYNSKDQVDWSMRNLTPLQFDSQGQPVFRTFDRARPDANVATLYSYDGLGRTVLLTETGILTGTVTLQADGTPLWQTTTERVTRTDYDPFSRPVTVTVNYQPGKPVDTLPDVNVRTITQYDAAGNVTGRRDTLGRWTYTEYDALNRPTLTIANYENGDPLTVASANRAWTDGTDTDIKTITRYTADGQVSRQVANAVDEIFTATELITDRVMLYQYDPLGRVQFTTMNYDGAQATRTDTNRVEETRYDAAKGWVIGAKDPLDRWTSMQYDALGRVTTMIRNCRTAAGQAAPQGCAAYDARRSDRNVSNQTRYDQLGRAFETVDPLGIVTRTEYDGVGRVKTTIQNYRAGVTPDQQTNVTARTGYDGLGRTTVMTDAVNAVTRMGYDGLGRVTTMTDAVGRATRQGYDGAGALRWTRRPDGTVSIIQIDGLGRAITTIQNFSNGAFDSDPSDRDLITRTVYDRGGRRTRVIDPAQRLTDYAYNLRDELTSVLENIASGVCPNAPCNVQTRYRYDRAGNRVAIVDANNHTRRFTYTAADEQLQAIDGRNRITTWNYDKGGRQVKRVDPRGVSNDVTYGYDDLDRLISTSAQNLTAPIARAYDGLGRATVMTDTTGVTRWGYDVLGRVLSVQQPNVGTVGYQYTARGERRQITYPNSGPVIDYTYTPDGQLDLVRQGSTQLADYTYDGRGRVRQLTRANNTTTFYAYDKADRLRDLRSTLSGSSSEINHFEYQVDRLGLRTVVTETLGLGGSAPTATPSPTAGAATNTPTSAATNTPTSAATNTPTATPTSGGAFQEQSGQVVMEAENASANVSRGGKSWVARTDVSGFAGSAFMRAEPDTGATIDDTTYPTTQTELRYQVNITTPGTYHVWVRMYAADSGNNSVHVGLDGQAVTSADKISSNTFGAWTWNKATTDGPVATLNIATAGLHTINVWMREDGFRVDRLLLTTNSAFTPSGTGPAESPRGGGATATPTSGATATPTRTATASPTSTRTPTPTPTGTGAMATPTPTPTPATIPTSGLGLWLKSDTGVSVSGTAVTGWADQSGNNRTASQGTSANQPALVTNALNGKPAIRFDGTNDFLQATMPISGLQGLTLFVVSAVRDADAPTGPQNATLFWPETAAWGVTYLGAFQGRVNGRMGAGQTNNNLLYTRPSNIGSGYTRTSLLHDGPTGTDVLYINGAAVLTQTGKLSTIRHVQNTLWLGQGLSSTYFNGDIVEVLVYTRTLGAADRQQVETYLRQRYFPAVAGRGQGSGVGGQEGATTTDGGQATTNHGPLYARSVFAAADNGAAAQATPSPTAPATAARIPSFRTLPLAFVPNQGQTAPEVCFQARGLGGSLFFAPDGVVFALPASASKNARRAPGADQSLRAPRHADPPVTVRMRLQGAQTPTQVAGVDQLPGIANFYLGDDPTQWRANLPTYGGIVYQGVYTGIDVRFDGADGQLKSTYIVAPGADPAQIRWRYEGTDPAQLDQHGNLRMTVAQSANRSSSGGAPPALTEHAPIAWQVIDGGRVDVPIRYTVAADGTISFTLGAYDRAHPLLIDPTLTYGTYLGGAGSDSGYGVAVDSGGNTYVVGYTTSTNFPTNAPAQGANNGGQDALLFKLDPSGSTLLFSTYLGGGAEDAGYAVTVDNAGSVYATGQTYSSNFPTLNPPPMANLGNGDIFLVKVNATSGALSYGARIGGGGEDRGDGIAVTSDGAMYLTGSTASGNFPVTTGVYQRMYGGGRDAFVAKLPAAGNLLTYATYLGGANGESGLAIVVDSGGNAIVGGATGTATFPPATTGAAQTSYGGGNQDGYIVKLNANATGLLFGTFMGGANGDGVFGLAPDSAGNVSATGFTNSPNFTTTSGAFQRTLGNGTCGVAPTTAPCPDAFVAQIAGTNGARRFTTFLGGAGDDEGSAITLDSAGNLFVVGWSASSDFPIRNAIQSTNGGGYDAFVAGVTATGSGLIYSTYLGGSADEYGSGIARSSGAAHIVGWTGGTDLPIANPRQGASASGQDAFVAMLSDAAPTPPSAATRTIRYAYDGLLRLRSAQESGATTNSYAYAYDNAGNRTSVTVNGATTTTTYDAANQVNGWTYDAAGNLTNDGTTSYAYDALSRLTTRGSVGQTYNGDGVLVAQTSGSTTTRSAQDLASPLGQVLQIGTTNYLYGMERLAAQTGSARVWYGADALGSVRQTLDAAGVPQATISDDPWGYSRGQGSGIRGQERCGSTTRRLIRQPVQQCCPPL
jgi:YD repeat-containing protein